MRCCWAKRATSATNRSVNPLKTTGERIGLPHTSRRNHAMAPGVWSVGMYAFKIRRSIERYGNATAELQTSASVFIPASCQDLAGILLRNSSPAAGDAVTRLGG